jgi:UDP-glucose-4-epimerase GalE
VEQSIEFEKPIVLVTGAAGYIGSHVLAGLIADGYPKDLIFGLDNFASGFQHPLLNQIGFSEVDLTDISSTSRIIEEVRPDVVIHLAGNRYARKSLSNPIDVYSSNTTCTTVVSESIRRLEKKVFIVFSSSCAVYGDKKSVVKEDDQFYPVSPYGRSKIMCEQILEDFHLAGGAIPISLRYFNAAGLFPPGAADTSREGLFANLIHHANSGTKVPVFGDDLPTRDGSCVRDYISVRDIAKAHIAVLDRILNGYYPKFSSYNLGTGIGHSVFEVINLFNSLIERSVEVDIQPASNGDPFDIAANSARFSSEFDWNPNDSIKTIIKSLSPLVSSVM